MRVLAAIPSPSRGVWHLGPMPIRAYALCIIVGIIVAVWLTERRWQARGGQPGTVTDVAATAVPFGLVGGRLYNVITDPELYFGAGRHPIEVFYVWRGGLGIWGAVALGGVGAWIALHRRGVKLAPFGDAAAPGIVLAQGIGRLGNYFNQELYGGPTTLPWALHITSTANGDVPGYYHPTFLYELIWDFAVAALVLWADRRFRLGRGRAFALYLMGYTLGRGWIEQLRIDHANEFFGIRLNDYTAVIVFLLALAWFLTHRGPREEAVDPRVEQQDQAERAAVGTGGAVTDDDAGVGTRSAGHPPRPEPARPGTKTDVQRRIIGRKGP